jgi:ribosome biogenesis GTPase
VIDTPGLRELALWRNAAGGIDSTFPEIEELFGDCRFADCGHGEEPGCAVRRAIEEGRLDAGRWQSYLKLEREAERTARRRDAKGRHEERKKHKAFARMLETRVDKRDRH